MELHVKKTETDKHTKIYRRRLFSIVSPLTPPFIYFSLSLFLSLSLSSVVLSSRHGCEGAPVLPLVQTL